MAKSIFPFAWKQGLYNLMWIVGFSVLAIIFDMWAFDGAVIADTINQQFLTKDAIFAGTVIFLISSIWEGFTG